MVFSSLLFLYAFFSLSLGVYVHCKNQEAQNRVLLVFSLIFYAWGEPKYVFLLMLMAFTSWVCALGVERGRTRGKKRAWVIAAAVIDLGLIGYFKYASLFCGLFGPVPEFVSRIALPIGISFYTFQLLTYVVDVYRDEAPAQKRYWNVLLYAALFHQCIAGPIVRYKTIDRELFGQERRQPELARGVSRFAAGLAKKALLANPCGALADSLILAEAGDLTRQAANLSYLGELSVLGAWVGIAAYALHIYLDFSAYSDMAIGMGQMLGLHYLENFNYPYCSRSVTEFWRRWHISLGTFFRDYVYIPLGGSRCAWPRMVLNTLAVWLLTGLWHGASWNFVLWGGWFFVFLLLERFLLKKLLDKLQILSHLYLLTVVLLGWVIFRYSDLTLGLTLARSLFGANGNPLTSFAAVTQLKSHLWLLVAGVIACLPLLKGLKARLEGVAEVHPFFAKVWDAVFYGLIPTVLLLLSTANLVGDSYNPFIYFQF